MRVHMAENVKVSKFSIIRKNFLRFFKEVRNELKKVIWLNKEQLINNTSTVLISCLIIGMIIWVADGVLAKIIEIAIATK